MKNKLLLFTIETKPNKDNPEKDEFGGAYANVWVNNTDIVEAESILLGESNRHLDKAWVYYNKAQGLWNNGKLQSAINYFAKTIGKVKDALR